MKMAEFLPLKLSQLPERICCRERMKSMHWIKFIDIKINVFSISLSLLISAGFRIVEYFHS